MIKSVCGYCGVGCGLEYDEKSLIGDVTYPVNFGSVCSKGVSELVSIQTESRLLRPMIRENIDEDLLTCKWEDATSLIAQKIKQTSKEKIGFYLSGQLLTEDYYIANKLGKGFIGTGNVDTNSRTCMSSAVVAYKKSIGADFVPLRMNDIFKSDLLILAGANTAEAHVVFHNRIKKAKKEGLKVVVIDPRNTDTAKIADIYLPIKVGGDIDFFNLISNWARRIALSLSRLSYAPRELICGSIDCRSAKKTVSFKSIWRDWFTNRISLEYNSRISLISMG